MRTAFISSLLAEAKKNPNILLLTGDLGFGVLKEYIEEVPNQFINCGISEANMLTMAGALASLGKIVFVYSIGNFPTLRALEQIRNDICYRNFNVKIICIGGGYTYGTLGVSHHAIEDIGVMRMLPNMHIFTPSDKSEASKMLNEVISTDGPCYIRLERDSKDSINTNVINLAKPQHVISNKSGIALFSYGTIAREAEEIANEYKLNLYLTPCLKPIDKISYIKELSKYKTIITLEEHSLIGGLGEILSSLIVEESINTKLIKFGIKDSYSSIVGNQELLRKDNNIDKESVISALKTKNIIE